MSTNKTKVNGEAVLKRFLASKDLLEFGGSKALFLLPSDGKSKKRGSVNADSPRTLKWLPIAIGIAAICAAAVLYFLYLM
jgi:hypothetical protein